MNDTGVSKPESLSVKGLKNFIAWHFIHELIVMIEKDMQENDNTQKKNRETSELDEFFTFYNEENDKIDDKVEEEKKVEKVKDYDFIPAKRGGDKKKNEAKVNSSDLINELESSLINFLTSRKNIESAVSGGSKRVRSLKFNINVKESKPFFTVQIGVCEASFSVENGSKEKGSCFGAERFIKTWYESGSVAMDIHKCVAVKLAEKKED